MPAQRFLSSLAVEATVLPVSQKAFHDPAPWGLSLPLPPHCLLFSSPICSNPKFLLFLEIVRHIPASEPLSWGSYLQHFFLLHFSCIYNFLNPFHFLLRYHLISRISWQSYLKMVTSYVISFSILLHSVWQSLGPSTLLKMALFHSFYGRVIFHCISVPPLLYLFLCWWAYRGYHILAIVNSVAMNIGVHSFGPCFSPETCLWVGLQDHMVF